VTDRKIVEDIKKGLPEMPQARKNRFIAEFKLSDYDAAALTAKKDVADYFEEAMRHYKNAKVLANWVMGDMTAEINSRSTDIRGLGILPKDLAELLKMLDSRAISGKMAKDVLAEAVETKKSPADIVSSKGLSQISDRAELERIVKAAVSANEKSVKDYKAGKKAALTFLVGQVMKATSGKADPGAVNELLKKALED
jgi:aspartyl-tRNA(Asn)/glutamyl-tRNA(Gln) amidotransferase subunit B